jgi:hypothetical protein
MLCVDIPATSCDLRIWWFLFTDRDHSASVLCNQTREGGVEGYGERGRVSPRTLPGSG